MNIEMKNFKNAKEFREAFRGMDADIAGQLVAVDDLIDIDIINRLVSGVWTGSEWLLCERSNRFD